MTILNVTEEVIAAVCNTLSQGEFKKPFYALNYSEAVEIKSHAIRFFNRCSERLSTGNDDFLKTKFNDNTKN
jgi:hypothetical protein